MPGNWIYTSFKDNPKNWSKIRINNLFR